MRKVVTISIPGEMHENLVRRISRTRYATVSEYIRDLIRRDDPGQGEPGNSKATLLSRDKDLNDMFIIRTGSEILNPDEKDAGRDAY